MRLEDGEDEEGLVPNDVAMMRYQFIQRFQTLLTPPFLNESDGDDDSDGNGDTNRVVDVTHDRTDSCTPDQE